MNNHAHSDDRLDAALAALRQSAPAAGPAETLLKMTMARVGAGEMNMGSADKGWWTMKMVRRTVWGTGLAAAALALFWMIFGMGGRMVFADVVERVNAAKMLRCKISTDVVNTGQGKVTQTGTIIMSQTWMIMRTANMKMIVDNEKSQMITLTEATKQALVMNQKNAPAAAPVVNILDSFRKFDAQASTPLGDRQIDGQPARGFEITQGNQHMKVWADLKTELPVRIEIAGANPVMPDTNVTFTDFDWNPTVTPEEISREIPKDYAVINANVDASKPTEADVPKMLSSWIELNGGKFPETLTFAGYVQLSAADMARRQAAETAGMTPEQKSQWLQKMTSEMINKMMPLSRGIAFIGDPASGSDWRYAGSGADVGAKGRAILWYKPANATAWRVFDADLTVHDAANAPAGGTPVSLSTKDMLNSLPGATQPALSRPVKEITPVPTPTLPPTPTPVPQARPNP